MAARSALSRDRRGRFITVAEQFARLEAAFTPPERWVDPQRPSDAAILANPTDKYPRWRLRVFDTCWPWRATRGGVLRDALASGNARRDREDRVVYLDACANIQRDPPWPLDRYEMRQRRAAERAR